MGNRSTSSNLVFCAKKRTSQAGAFFGVKCEPLGFVNYHEFARVAEKAAKNFFRNYIERRHFAVMRQSLVFCISCDVPFLGAEDKPLGFVNYHEFARVAFSSAFPCVKGGDLLARRRDCFLWMLARGIFLPIKWRLCLPGMG